MRSLLFVAVTVFLVAASTQAGYEDDFSALGPLTYWTFEDATCNNGDAAADAMGLKDLTYGLGHGFIPGIPGTSSQGVSLDGTTPAFLDFSHAIGAAYDVAGLPTGNAERTMAIWFQFDASALGTKRGLLSYGNRYEDGGSAELAANSNGKIQFMSPYGFYSVESPDSYADGEWHMAVGTIVPTGNPDEATWTLYIDGAYVDHAVYGKTQTSVAGYLQGTYVGASAAYNWAGGTYHVWLGGVDEAGILDVALDENTIAALYDAGITEPIMIPEPATLSLLGLGALALLRRRRR